MNVPMTEVGFLVNSILEGAQSSGAYELVDMKTRQNYNDEADKIASKFAERVYRRGYAEGFRAGWGVK